MTYLYAIVAEVENLQSLVCLKSLYFLDRVVLEVQFAQIGEDL